ncbi:MAG: hypothetical protein AB7F43_14870 [Bacteriovoracia bacterium]
MSNAALVNQIYQTFSGANIPEDFEYAKIGAVYWVNIVQSKTAELITDKIYSGFDTNFTIAASKAISEKTEREAFQFGFDVGDESCQSERSDGFAVMPRNHIQAQEVARENALNEAIERYVWAKWWDNKEVSFKHEILKLSDLSKDTFGPAIDLLNELSKKIDIINLHLIIPQIAGATDKELLIYVAELKDGVITGGACGAVNDRQKTNLRAISELFRHGLVLVQNPGLSKASEEATFYERRLFYFASIAGYKKFYDRINQLGTTAVTLPRLAIDFEISHPKEKSFVAYRCLFENQPPFIGGAIDRMCL